MQSSLRGLNILQKISMSLMGILVLITFVGANLHAVLWQSSEWLVSTVLPAVVVKLTNEERAVNNAAPLQRNATLDAAAKLKADDMAKNEYFSHFSPTGVSPWHWFDQAGYVYAHAGENLAIHFTDSSEVVDAWMKSPTHRQNIVSGLYTEIGVGTAKGKFDGYDTVYVVQLFGAPGVTPVLAKATPTPKPEPIAKVVESPAAALQVAVVPTEVVSTTEPQLADKEVLSVENIVTETPQDPELTDIAEADELNEQTEEEVVLVSEQTEPYQSPVSNENFASEMPAETISVAEDVVVIESPIIATSSGLAIANITTVNDGTTVDSAASIATQPNELLQIVYIVLGIIILLLLSASIIVEARRLRFIQVAYGFILLFGMGGLWYVHSLLTAGAVII